jgi:hypothetical protein
VRSSCAAPAGEASLGGEGCLDAREQLRAGRRHGCIGVLIPVTRLDNWLAGSGNSGSAATRDCC